MGQHTISSMMSCNSINCLQGGCHASWLQNWKNDVLMPARNFWNALTQKLMASSEELLREMKHGPTSTSRKPRKRARNGALPHQDRKYSAHNHLRERLCWLCVGMSGGNFGALHAHGGHCDQCKVCRSEESPASCSKVQTTWTSEYRCFTPTWQCSA